MIAQHYCTVPLTDIHSHTGLTYKNTKIHKTATTVGQQKVDDGNKMLVCSEEMRVKMVITRFVRRPFGLRNAL